MSPTKRPARARQEPTEVVSLGREDVPGGEVLVRVSTQMDGARHAVVYPRSYGLFVDSGADARRALQSLQDAVRDRLEADARVDEFAQLVKELGGSYDLIGWCMGITGAGAKKRLTR